jgi:tetratricopeptide (TPR) repeat protein
LQEQARDAFTKAGDPRGRIYALAELGTLACRLRRPAEAERLLEEARAELSGADSFVHVSVLCSLADAYVSLNRLRDAAEASEEALARAAVVETTSNTLAPSMQLHALYRLAMVHLREGRLASATEIGARAADIMRDHQLDPETEVQGDNLIGLVRWVKGDLDGALELLSRAATLASAHGLTWLAHGVQVSMAEVLTGLDRLEEADALFEALGNPTEFFGDVGMLRFVQGRLNDAHAIFRQQLDTASRAGSVADVGRAKAALGAVALGLGHYAQAEQWLLDSARGLEHTGARFRLAGVHLHLAHLHYLQHDLVRCRQYLRQSLEFAAEAECYMFFLWHPATVATMAAHALSEKIYSEFVEQLCLRRLRAFRTPSFLPLLSSRDPGVRDPATRIVFGLLEQGGEGLSLVELGQCRDASVRARLTSALVDERLTSHGLLMLRHHHSLTWAELDVFVAYYLTEPQTLVGGLEPERRLLAQRLHLSENTLMHHITSIRHKLQIGGRRGSAAVFLWALLSHITRLPSSHGDVLARQPSASDASAPARGTGNG